MTATGWQSSILKRSLGRYELVVLQGQNGSGIRVFFWYVQIGTGVIVQGRKLTLGAAKAEATRQANALVRSDRQGGDAR